MPERRDLGIGQLTLGARSVVFQGLLRARGIQGRRASCDGMLPVVHSDGDVEIGARFAVRAQTARVEFGAGPGATLRIGDGAFLNQGASIVASLAIDVGDNFRMGDYAAVYDTSHHAAEEGDEPTVAAVVIGDNVWLGRSALVLPGVTIGSHAVVAAGAVVTHDVAERTLVAGLPARPVRTLRASPGWRRT